MRAIIFDFDGVIVDSVGIKEKAFQEIYKPFGKEVVEKVIQHHYENGGVSRFEKIKFYHKYFLEMELNNQELKDITDQFSMLVLDKVVASPYIPGSDDFINNYYNKYLFFISSATPELEINKICIRRGINKKFKGIYGSPKTKSMHVESILHNWNLNRDEVLFIGDSLSDYEAAKKFGLHFLPVGSVLKSIDKFTDSSVNNLVGIENLIKHKLV